MATDTVKNVIINVKSNTKGLKDLETSFDKLQKENKQLATQYEKTNKKLNKNMTETSNSALNMSKIFNQVGTAIAGAFAVQQVVQFAKEMSNLSLQMEQIDKKAKIVFGERFKEVEQIARRTSTALGLTASEFKRVASGIQDLLVPLGFARDEATDLTLKVTDLSGALAAWSAGQYDAVEAGQILAKTLLGEAEQIKSMGIVIDQSSKAFNERINLLIRTEGLTMQQAKALEILEQIQMKSVDAQNAMNEAQKTGAERLLVVNARYRQLKENIAENTTNSNLWLTALENLAGFLENKQSAIFLPFGSLLHNMSEEEKEVAGGLDLIRMNAIQLNQALIDGAGNLDWYDTSLGAMKKRLEDLGASLNTLTPKTKAFNDTLRDMAKLSKEIKDAMVLPVERESGGIYDQMKTNQLDYAETVKNSNEETFEEWQKIAQKQVNEQIKNNETIDEILSESYSNRLSEQQFYADALIQAAEITAQTLTTIWGQQVQKQTDARINSLEKQLAADEITQGEFERRRKKALRDQAEREKELALLQINIAGAVASARVWSSAEGDYTTKLILQALVAAETAAQIAIVANQPIPEFEKGGEIKGNRHRDGGVLLEAEGGEYIINRLAYGKNKKAVQAINDHKFDKYIIDQYIKPSLKIGEIQALNNASFADRIAESVKMQAFDDQRLVGWLQKQVRTTEKQTDQLTTALKTNRKDVRNV